MDAGHITPGKIDDRPIQELTAADVIGYERVHFFAGIAGWDYALNLANWGSRFVWTGSCPCQPFSAAGKKGRQSDERNLWPHWGRLITKSSPATVFGEQVDDAVAAGWLDDVFYDLEKENYACAAALLPACSVGAPHERQRIWFVAHHASADAARWNQAGRGISGLQKMEKIVANSHQEGRENGQVESRIREAEIFLNRCAFVEAWQDWNGGFSGFGRVDDGVSPKVAKSTMAGLGNAIVPQLAAEFIRAYMECKP